MGKKITTINFSHKLKYKEENNEYTIQMVRRRKPWWLLLLLLPLLLLIRCEKDISVSCFEPDTKVPIEKLDVKMEYQAHYLWNNGRFFATDIIKRTQKTDAKGETVFKDLPCSVYSYIFYCLSDVSFTAKSGCHAASDEKHNFHFTRHVDLTMAPRLEDLHVKVVDLETGDLLPGATLIFKYTEQGKEITDSAKADAAGVATMPKMRYCSVINMMKASCYGYADTLRSDIPCQDMLVANDSTALRLRPIKERFTFFVKNKETKQPIPEADCVVVLTRPTGGASQPRTVKTSIDGKGIAAYDSAFVLSTIDITARKLHYKPGKLEGGPWTVDKFRKQNNDTRTIWLEPEPYMEEFQNVDSINGKPIAGVKNEITITDPTGKVEKVTEISNSNGIFPVTAKENSKIEIVSIKSPEYKTKNTVIAKFKTKEKIRMSPNMEKRRLKTVKDANSYPLLPQCNLRITGSVSGTLQPTNSGTGEFDITARVNDNISIVASKSGYITNSSTVRNTPMSTLQNGTQIPLKADPKPINYSKGIKGTTQECYELNEGPTSFKFTWSTCTACTMLTVLDDNGRVLARYGIDSPGGDSQGTVYPPASGTTTLRSSTKRICVIVQNTNGCNCSYTILEQ